MHLTIRRRSYKSIAATIATPLNYWLFWWISLIFLYTHGSLLQLDLLEVHWYALIFISCFRFRVHIPAMAKYATLKRENSPLRTFAFCVECFVVSCVIWELQQLKGTKSTENAVCCNRNHKEKIRTSVPCIIVILFSTYPSFEKICICIYMFLLKSGQ